MTTTNEPTPEPAAAPDRVGASAPAPSVRAVLRAVRDVVRAIVLPVIVLLGLVVLVLRDEYLGPAWAAVAIVLLFVPCALLAVLSLRAVRSPRARRAARPVEAGIFVGVVVWLAVAIFGGVPFVDSFASAAVVAVGATLLAGVLHPLLEGRRRARTAFAALLVTAIAVGGWGSAVFTGTFDHYDDTWFGIDGMEPQRAVLSRIDSGGIRLGSTSGGIVPTPLSSGHVDALAYDPFVGTTAAASFVGPDNSVATPAPGPIAAPSPVAVAAPTSPIPPLTEWAVLRARADGRLALTVDRGIAGTLDRPVIVRVQRGTCAAPTAGAAIDSWTWPGGSGGTDRRTLPIGVDDLRIGTRLAVVVGTREPLAPTRCGDLVSGPGVALATLGGGRFHRDCIAPLDVAPRDVPLLAASSFADQACADRLELLGGVLAGAVVPAARVAEVRDCIAAADSAAGVDDPPVEHPIPGGVAIERRNLAFVDDPFAACTSPWNEPIAWPVSVVDPNAVAAGDVPASAVPASAITDEFDGEDPAAVAEKIR